MAFRQVAQIFLIFLKDPIDAVPITDETTPLHPTVPPRIGCPMPQQSVSPRHFLDQAFWGLILSICVIMGGGICVLGFGKKVPNATDVAASDQRKSAPARAGTVVPGSRRPPGKIDEPRTAHRPSHRPATRTPEAGEAREPTELAATGRSESLDSANTIGIGPIEPDDSGAPAVDIRSVSSSASQFAGIEQRLIGAKLHKHFPAQDGDEENPNELPDDISYDM